MVASGGYRVLSDAELKASLDAALAAYPADRDVWLFAYGSLIWNPAFHFVEHRIATVHGLHRRFCLWTELGRGSPDRPGLGARPRPRRPLPRGRLPPRPPRRGASSAGLAPRDGDGRLPAALGRGGDRGGPGAEPCTFVINRAARALRRAASATTSWSGTLATARGALGPSADYLFSTAAHLEQLGIADHGARAPVRRGQGLPLADRLSGGGRETWRGPRSRSSPSRPGSRSARPCGPRSSISAASSSSLARPHSRQIASATGPGWPGSRQAT